MSKLFAVLLSLFFLAAIPVSAKESKTSPPDQASIIIDDWYNDCGWFDRPCNSDGDFALDVDVEAPNIGTVFRDTGVSESWQNHAYWARATSSGSFGTGQYSGTAQWTVNIRQSGWYYVEAFIPNIYTEMADTVAAEYEIQSSQGVDYTVINQPQYVGEWARLGEFYFEGGGGAHSESPDSFIYRVTLSTHTDDAQYGRSILFDAIKWVQRDSVPPPTPRPVPTQPGGNPPPVPTGFRGVPFSQTSISLSWNDVAGETSYYVEGHQANEYIAANITTHRVNRLVPGTQYSYRLYARNSWGESVTDWIWVSTFTETPIPTPTPEPEEVTPVVILPGYGHTLPFTDKTVVAGKYLPPARLKALYTVLTEVYQVPTEFCVYNWWDSNALTTDKLHECIKKVGGTEARPVHIITHSNGGQVARAYLQNHPNPLPVKSLQLIAPPNQGVLSAYLIWAGGDLSLEAEQAWIINIAVGMDISCRLYGSSCIKDFVHRRFRSINDLIPSDRPYLIDTKTQRQSGSLSYPNTWLERLNNSASSLFDNVETVVVHRGVGLQTPEMLRIDSMNPGQNGLWLDGMPPLFDRVTRVTGDDRILANRTLIPGLIEGEEYDVIDYAGASHGSVISSASDNILAEMGLEDGRDLSLPSVSESKPWAFIYAGGSFFEVKDSRGRSTGYGMDGTMSQDIPDSEVVRTVDPPATLVLLPNVESEDYQLILASNSFFVDQPFQLSILSGESSEFAYWKTGVVPSGDIRFIEVNPRENRLYSLYLPQGFAR